MLIEGRTIIKKYLIVFFITMLIVFCVLYGFQRQEKLLPPEEHEVKVRLVLVDLIVTKHGKFVMDLTKDDFELYEDGKRVPINSFELISFAERKLLPLKERKGETTSPVPKKKLTVIFDGINTLPRHFKRGTEKIVNELIELVKLGNEVMIAQLHRKKGVEILQPFTLNEELIGKAVAKAAGNIWVDRSLDVLKMELEVGIKSTRDQVRASRIIDKSVLREALMEEYHYLKKQRFEKTIGGILAVINMIKDSPGRKSILLISDGIPNLFKKIKGLSILSVTTVVLRDGYEFDPLYSGGGYGPIKVSDPSNILDKKGIMRGEDVIKELIGFANSQNISIYSLDPGPFTEYFITDPAESDPLATLLKKQEKISQVQSLRRISEDTGAAWLRGAKKYDIFRQVISTDLNYYYQLSFYPIRKEADNKYHKIRVKVKRKGVDLRFRKGYTDYSEEQEGRMLLIAAFYSPSLYKALPFEAEFIPLHKDSDKYEPWMNIALPVKKLFGEREVAYGPKKFNLHVWVKEKKRGDKAFGGQTTISFNIDSSFVNFIKSTDYLCYHFKGPELEFSDGEYQAIFALFDEKTEEIGTRESSLTLPDLKENKEGAIINCVLGLLASNPKGAKKSFSLSKKDGSLEYGEIKFFPAVTNRFQQMQNVSVFLQVYLPQGKIKIHPQFKVLRDSNILQNIPGEIVAEAWNEKSKVWSRIFNLNLRNVSPGDYTLKVNFPVSEGDPVLSKEVKLTKLRY